MKRINYYLFLFFALIAIESHAQYAAPESGKVYRILSPKYSDLAVSEDYGTNKLSCSKKGNDKSYPQMWIFKKQGTLWSIQNVYTGRYIVQNGTMYTNYKTSANASSMFISANPSLSGNYNILNNSNTNIGMHCDAGMEVVPWSNGTTELTGGEWKFQEVNIDDSEIEIARAEYEAYLHLMENKDEISATYTKFFTDDACTKLSPSYASMSDEDLSEAMKECGNTLISIALKVKNDSWAEYEKEFRLANYAPHSDVDKWSRILKTSPTSPLNNPTGIYGNAGDIMYVFVGADIPSGSSLQIDMVNGNSHTGTKIGIKKGMNIIPIGRNESMLFVLYTVDTTGDKLISNFDSIPINIQGGVLNGYWDSSRHTDSDWVKITRSLATHEMIQIKGEKTLLHMHLKEVTASNCCPNTITDVIEHWDNIVKWEFSVMGLEDIFPMKFNNRIGVRSTPTGFMSAGSYFTNFQFGTLTSILPKKNVTDPWGPAHEIGHVLQGAINLIGCTEVSNNLFSNIVVYKYGRQMSRGATVANKASYYETAVPFSSQSIWQTTRMYFQLYMYYHLAGNNPEFYPKLFKLLREDPLKKVSGSLNYGSTDYLKFAEKCAEAAGEDLTEFFDACGLFIPVNNIKIADYSTYYLTTTKQMIDATKKKLAEYPKKSGAIEFIEDRAAYSPRLDGTNGNRLVYDVAVGQAGDLGQYTAYTPDSMLTKASGYLYQKVGKSVTFSSGSGAVGFRVYNTEGKRLTFCNTFEYTLPEEIASHELLFKAVSANGQEADILSVYEAGDDEAQKAALVSAIKKANEFLKLSDATGKKVGYYYSYFLTSLVDLRDSAKSALETNDTGEHTLGQWAKLISQEMERMTNDKNSRIWFNPKNYYRFNNVQYSGYSITYNNTGVLNCTKPMKATDIIKFTFIPTGIIDGEYYMKNANGRYVSKVSESENVMVTASSISSAVKFKITDNNNGRLCIQKVGDEMGYLHSSQYYALVGWNSEPTASSWNVVCTDDNQAMLDRTELDSLVSVANLILDDIVDTLNSSQTNTVLYDHVEVLDNNILTYISDLKHELDITAEIRKLGQVALYPKQCDVLAKKITILKTSYTLPTGIDGVEQESGENVIYDIRGRRVERMLNDGIYIINGKKTYITVQ